MSQKHCPRCHAPLDASSPNGLCPRCLVGDELERADEPQRSAAELAEEERIRAELAQALPGVELHEVLGRGGMGVVFRGVQRALGRPVAVKVLPPELSQDPSFLERFEREARVMAKLEHDNIVRVYDFGRVGSLCYLVMEFVEGANLRQLGGRERLAPADALAIVPQICDALQYAHDRGVVHRDVKPENILVDVNGRVKIADFGLAKLDGGRAAAIGLTGSQQVMGTYHYMAPEQMERPLEVDHRADIYSLGVVFYELLTGHVPQGRFEAPSKLAEVDGRMDEVVLRSLERERERRYQRVNEVRTDLDAIRQEGAAVAPAAARSEAVREPVFEAARTEGPWSACPSCGVAERPKTETSVKTVGWIAFVLLLMSFPPICWLPFVIDWFKRRKDVCKRCGFERWREKPRPERDPKPRRAVPIELSRRAKLSATFVCLLGMALIALPWVRHSGGEGPAFEAGYQLAQGIVASVACAVGLAAMILTAGLGLRRFGGWMTVGVAIGVLAPSADVIDTSYGSLSPALGPYVGVGLAVLLAVLAILQLLPTEEPEEAEA